MEKPKLTHTMKVVCCICNKDMGTKPCSEQVKDLISHSYCPECGERELRKIEEEK